MKLLKKLMVVFVAALMVMSLAIKTYAETVETPSGKITVTNAVEGEKYSLYKVFDATTDGNGAYAYSSTWFTTANDYFDVDASGNITIKDAGKTADGKLSTAAIDWLKTQISNFRKIGNDVTAGENKKVEWTGLEDGYYFVNTTTGSFVLVDSTRPDVSIEEKNTVPSGDKKQSATKTGTYADTPLELNIGDTVYYQYVITNGKGSDKDIIFTDTMTDGLDLQDAITVVGKGGTTLIKDTDYTLETTAHGFVLTLKADYVKKMAESDTVTINYSAIINEKAVVNSETGNKNTGKLEYSNQTTEDTVYVKTYDFLLKKTDGTAFLSGAGFKLFDAQTGGNQIKVAKDNTGYFVKPDGDASTEIMVDSATGVNVRGLKPGTYYLEETTVPKGYKKPTSRQAVTITAGATSAVEVEVVNTQGPELPSTGGIGTTIFHIAGAALVLGAGILLISKKRMNNN